MNSILKNAIKYVLMLGLGGLLFWYVLKDQDPNKIADDFRHANYFWIAVSVLVSIVAYWSRAVRWNLLLEPLDIKPPVYKTFLALMSGYFANLLLPRAGEVARCLILNKMEKAPFNSTFGSVVAERVFDLIGLLIVIGLTFVFEFSLISGFLSDIFINKFRNLFSSLQHMYLVLLIVVVVLITLSAVIWMLRNKIKQNTLYQNIAAFISGVWKGVIGIKDLEKKWQFLFHSILIWVCYYFMTYTVFFAFEPTAHLGMGAGLVLLVVGALGMSAPVQGGIGVFHLLVSSALVIYGVSEQNGVSYAFLLHTSQAMTVVVFGGISFVISLLIGKNKETEYADLKAE
ncbi:lysylphosphatidylglycerol synthase transmembrane domain-containing protein [Cytophaga aurantiaca]|uniref:lysylphosphatidylglycerol synthase transmembrane domain-containing protein n=1 Tax=Cytophaga aurantiaca TaxID=29530 RepID=UPI000476BDDE|nr:lysylphosphatidylglycerol synthase transmembrane domain-containing protein [Cytophaga aurantiaca]